MAKILYHVTQKENVDSILKDGLLRCHGNHESAFISLSEDPDSWLTDGLVVLGVNVSGLKCRLTTWAPDGLDEVCAWGDIPPDRIRVIKE